GFPEPRRPDQADRQLGRVWAGCWNPCRRFASGCPMTPGRLIPSLLTLSLCAIAAVTDVRTGRIPNRLVAWGLGLGAALPVASALVAARPEGVLVALVRELGAAFAGLLVTAAVPLVLFSMRALGGGDVKLFAAVGALAGPGLG